MKKLLLLFMLISTITKAQTSESVSNSGTKKGTHSAPAVSNLGNNVISFSPMTFTLSTRGQSSPDMGVALAFERISQNGYIGFKLPVMASLYNPYYTFMPAIKLYPAKQGCAKYAIGPQLLWATGNVKVAGDYNASTNKYDLITKQRSQFGFMLNNSFNFTIARHLFVGLDLSVGVIYYDNQPNAVYDTNNVFFDPYNSNNNNSISPFMQMGFGMGYRF